MIRIIFLLSLCIMAARMMLPGVGFSSDCNDKPSGMSCDPSDWSNVSEETIISGLYSSGDHCFFEINYKLRFCTNGAATIPQIKIIDIGLMDGNECQDFTIGEIMFKAVEEILYQSSVLADINDPSQAYDLQLVTPGCLSMTSNTLGGGELTSCYDTCCISDYEIEISSNKVWLNEKTAETTTDCSGAAGSCSAACGSHDQPIGALMRYNEPYYPDCLDCGYPFILLPDQYFDFTVGSCNATVYYDRRTACGPNELHINRIILEEGEDCDAYNMENILQYAIRKLLSEVENIFTNLSLPETVVLRSEKCWQRNGVMVAPCPDNYCCEHEYRVYEHDGKIKCNFNEPADIDAGSCSNPCGYECDKFELGDSTLLPKKAFRETNDLINTDLKAKSFVIPNPTTGNTEIYFRSQDKGFITLKIYDFIGNLIFTSDLQKTGREIIFSFDATKYANGLFNYQILYDNTLINTGKFIVSD